MNSFQNQLEWHVCHALQSGDIQFLANGLRIFGVLVESYFSEMVDAFRPAQDFMRAYEQKYHKKLTDKKLHAILASEPRIRAGRPITKNGTPDPHRLVIHIVDWANYAPVGFRDIFEALDVGSVSEEKLTRFKAEANADKAVIRQENLKRKRG